MHIGSVKANEDQAKHIDLVMHEQLPFGVLQLSNLLGNGTADVCRLGRCVWNSGLFCSLQPVVVLQGQHNCQGKLQR